MSYRLTFTKGTKINSSSMLNEGNEYILGRGSQCDIRVSEGDVSGRHLQLTVDSSGDLELKNLTTHPRTTFVNEEAISLGGVVKLLVGDEVTIGGSRSVAFNIEKVLQPARGVTGNIGDGRSSSMSNIAGTGCVSESSNGVDTYFAVVGRNKNNGNIPQGAGNSEQKETRRPALQNEVSEEQPKQPPKQDEMPFDGRMQNESDAPSDGDKIIPPRPNSHTDHPVRNFSRTRSPRWLFFASLLFSVSFALFLFHPRAGVLAIPKGDKGPLWSTLEGGDEKKAVASAFNDATNCFASPNPLDWQRGVLTLESVVRGERGTTSGRDKRKREVEQCLKDHPEWRRKILWLASNASKSGMRESATSTLERLGEPNPK